MGVEAEMINQSGIEPVGPRVLLLPDQVEEKTASGIVLYSEVQRAREELAQTEGTVVAIGMTAYKEPPFAPGLPNWCKPGDRVIFARHAGLISEGKDGKKYRIVYDRDIVAVKEVFQPNPKAKAKE